MVDLRIDYLAVKVLEKKILLVDFRDNLLKRKVKKNNQTIKWRQERLAN